MSNIKVGHFSPSCQWRLLTFRRCNNTKSVPDAVVTRLDIQTFPQRLRKITIKMRLSQLSNVNLHHLKK